MVKGASYRAASCSLIIEPKSMIHLSDDRRVMSIALRHGLSTSLLGRPFGFNGILSH